MNKKLPLYYSSEYTFGSPAFYGNISRSTFLLRFNGSYRTVAFRPSITRGLAFSWIFTYIQLNQRQNDMSMNFCEIIYSHLRRYLTLYLVVCVNGRKVHTIPNILHSALHPFYFTIPYQCCTIRPISQNTSNASIFALC